MRDFLRSCVCNMQYFIYIRNRERVSRSSIRVIEILVITRIPEPVAFWYSRNENSASIRILGCKLSNIWIYLDRNRVDIRMTRGVNKFPHFYVWEFERRTRYLMTITIVRFQNTQISLIEGRSGIFWKKKRNKRKLIDLLLRCSESTSIRSNVYLVFRNLDREECESLKSLIAAS